MAIIKLRSKEVKDSEGNLLGIETHTVDTDTINSLIARYDELKALPLSEALKKMGYSDEDITKITE
jgi:hypothetical protein|tara:strand:+ start:197 stop:394 length:198 start_codon:yes stop_codon:yes gene_type:complete